MRHALSCSALASAVAAAAGRDHPCKRATHHNPRQDVTQPRVNRGSDRLRERRVKHSFNSERQ